MKKIKRVTQFPLDIQSKGDTSFNINTRQLRVYKDNQGTYQDYDSYYVSKDIDALSLNGYYPLYRTQTLANEASPLGTSHPHDELQLGAAPAGITYPLYMPDGAEMYHGNYVDPMADDDGDGVPNFRDPALLGLTALPSAGFNLSENFTTPSHSGGTGGGVTVVVGDVLKEINNPGAGSTNMTSKDITLNATGVGVLIKSQGNIIKFAKGDPVTLQPGDTLIYQGGLTSKGTSSLGNSNGDSANYSGTGNFTTNSNNVVDVAGEFPSGDGTIDPGTQNNTSDNIEKTFEGQGLLVLDDGTTTIIESPASIPPNATLFVKSGSSQDNLSWDGSTSPFTTHSGYTVNLTNFLQLDGTGDGFINNSGDPETVSFTGDGVVVTPQGVVTKIISPYILPAGYMIFTGTYTSSSSGGGDSSTGGGDSSTGGGDSSTGGGDSSTGGGDSSNGDTGTDAGYTGTGTYSTSGGDVNVESELGGTGNGTIDSGTSNSGGSNISKTFDDNKQTAILINDQTGEVTQVTSSPAVIPPGSTLFIKTVKLDPPVISGASFAVDWGTFTVSTADAGTVVRFQISTDQLFESSNIFADEAFDRDNGTTITGLTPSTTYYIRAYQYTVGLNDDSEWSNVISGTTSAASKSDQTITFPAITATDLSAGTITFDGFATSSSGLPVTYSVHANDTAKASFSGTTLTLISAGDVTIHADQAGNATYNAAPQVSRTLTITDNSSQSGGGDSSNGDTGTDAGYTGTGTYSTSGGDVNVESELGGTGDGTIDSGTSNNGGSNISKTFDDTTQTAILINDQTGEVTQVTSSPATIPPGSTLFIKTPSVQTGDTNINRIWADQVGNGVSAGSFAGGWTPYHMSAEDTTLYQGQYYTITMDSTAFILGDSNNNLLETWLTLPGRTVLIKFTYAATYVINPSGNTILELSFKGSDWNNPALESYTYDLSTDLGSGAGRGGNDYSTPHTMTKL